MLKENQLYCMDAIEFMKQVDDDVVDLILTDLPYGTTACEWDTVIPLDKLWIQFKRTLKNRGVVVLTASQPFTTDLINSNRDWFRYELIWDKKMVTGFANVKYMPMKSHENILIFYKKFSVYNPQYRDVLTPFGKLADGLKSEVYGDLINQGERGIGYPKSILECPKPNNLTNEGNLHPTQKPLKLFRWLVKTYSNKNDLVLDCCVGSGTTTLACHQTGRRWLCNDNNPKYIKISNQRLKQTNLNAFSDTTETLNESPSLNTDLIQFASQTKSANADFPTEN